MGKNKKIKGNIVYSTNQDYQYDIDGDETIETPPPSGQNLKVWLDRKQRKGKVVTLIEGFTGNDDDLKSLANNLATSFTQQYFVWGFFHADPHPGNILVSPAGRIYLVDC